jgi:hypothetical protein
VSITLTYMGDLSRVRVEATGLADGYVRVERSFNELIWETVRGGVALEVVGGAITVDDFEFDPDVENHYRLVPAVDAVFSAASVDQVNGDAWEVPAGIRELTFDLFGAGAAGQIGAPGTQTARGGGGGGAYAQAAVEVSPGEELRLRVGLGGRPILAQNAEWDGRASFVARGGTLLAQADSGKAPTTAGGAGAGGSADGPASIGDSTNAGGAGGTRQSSSTAGGGGGGGAAGPGGAGGAGSNGASGTGGAGGTGEPPGGDGGAGGDTGDPGEDGLLAGGGGGGQGDQEGGDNLPVSGRGGNGRVAVHSWPAGTPESESITPSLAGQVWLKSVQYPLLNRVVVVTEPGEPGRDARTGIQDVKGRSVPVAQHDIFGAPTFDVELVTDDEQQHRELDLMLAAGGTLLLHTPAGCHVSGGYVAVMNMAQLRRTRSGRSPRRYWPMQCRVVAKPDAHVIPATLTWATVLRIYGSWSQLIAAHPTWRDLLATVGSPEDLVAL